MNCHSCLTECDESFCSSCSVGLFGGLNLSHILDFGIRLFNEALFEIGNKLSVSGMQDKISIILENNELQISEDNGEYILKPIPSNLRLRFIDQMPQNEHFSMQVFKQIFHIPTSENAIVELNDNQIAYLTKRFDKENKKIKGKVEDFTQIMDLTEESVGKNFKYTKSYQTIGVLLKQYSSKFDEDVIYFFKQVFGNFIIGNDDGHLKNYSLITIDRTTRLAPAYDIVNTKMLLPTDFNLAIPLFDNIELGIAPYDKDSFIRFGEIIGISMKKTKLIIDEMLDQSKSEIKKLIDKSFLADVAKKEYLVIVQNQINALENKK